MSDGVESVSLVCSEIGNQVVLIQRDLVDEDFVVRNFLSSIPYMSERHKKTCCTIEQHQGRRVPDGGVDSQVRELQSTAHNLDRL